MDLLHMGIDEDFFHQSWRNWNYFLKHVTADSVFDPNDSIPAENHHRIKFLRDQFEAIQKSKRKLVERRRFALSGEKNWQEELKEKLNNWKIGKI